MASAELGGRRRHPWFEATPLPRVLAHRGLTTEDSAHAENTTAAIVAAISAGAHYIESDCHLTRDGEVVLFHDDSVERLTGDARLIADIDARDLARMMANRGGLLTLREALEGFPDVRWNIDVKATAAAAPVGTLVARHSTRVLVTSFSDVRRREALDAARRAGAAMRPATSGGTTVAARAVATQGVPALFRRAVRNIDALQIPVRHGVVPVLTRALVRAAHLAGIEVHVWTVNDIVRMKSLVEMDVDGVVTDRCDVALNLF